MAVPNWENTFQDGETFAPKVIDRLKQLATGTVTSVSAGDSTITVGGTATDPTIAVNASAVGDKFGLTPTAVKTSAYPAVAGDFVPVDTTSGTVTITLPTAPADGVVVAVKVIAPNPVVNAVTISCGGSDVFNKTSGSTSGTLTLLNQGILLQYKSSGAIWYIVADDLPASVFIRTLLDDADAATARTTLGLGTLATQSGTFSGTTSGTNTGDQTLPTDATISTTDVTTSNVTSTKHGWAPKSGADATTFLNGATTPAYASVKDSDLSTTDITTNDVSTTKHGFVPKAPNDALKFLNGTAAWSVPTPRDRDQLARTARGVISETWPWIASGSTATAFGATGASSAIAGTILGLRAGDVVTNLQCFCMAAGSSVTLFKLGLYKTDGTFLGATASLHASLAGNTFMTGAISGGAVTIATDGGYYVAGLTIASVTAPTFARTASQTGGSAAIGTGVKSYISVASQSDLTGNITPAAATTVFWFACN